MIDAKNNLQTIAINTPPNLPFWSAVGGITLATITSIALGIILGPFSAVLGFCAGGIAGTLITTIIYSCSCKETAQLPIEQQLTTRELIERAKQLQARARNILHTMDNR